MSRNDDIAIRTSGLTKSYPVFDKRIDVLWKGLKPADKSKDVLAIDDISITIRRGEVVGIIGRNGAGKSTLLKMIAGTLGPTSGRLQVKGRVSAILELGTGFNMEFTGRENILTGGMALGLTRDEIMAKFDWIMDFSELGHVIDQPFRTYSSGMQARLTFATSVAVDPEIFIVDEALAAGDNAFVEKCFARMDEIARSGATVLLVTHNTNLIARFGKRAIWLENGKMRADGDAIEVSKAYEIALYSSAVRALAPDELPDRLGDGDMKITKITCVGETVENEPSIFIQGKPFKLEFEVESKITSESANVCVQIVREDTVVVWTATTYNHMGQSYAPSSTPIFIPKGHSKVTIEMPALLLNSGSYFLNVGIEPRAGIARVNDYHDWWVRAASFAVVRSDSMILGKMFDSPSKWDVISANSSELGHSDEQTGSQEAVVS
jgi:ABC-type polysaccharide/polyol phosphate transport system ATPase subunit